MIYSRGFARCEAFINPLSASDVFLTVAIMSVAFLTEIALFILIGARVLGSAQPPAPANGLALHELDG
jgi:hypothetical protein